MMRGGILLALFTVASSYQLAGAAIYSTGANSVAATSVAANSAAASRSAAPLLCAPEDEDWLEQPKEDVVEDAQLLRKRGGKFKPAKDDRDKLLYEVTEVSPPPQNLGRFRLGPSAACGDLISARDETFVIKKVSYRYEFSRGSYRMVGKGAMVKRTDRHATEAFLERMLPPDEPTRADAEGAEPRRASSDGGSGQQ